MKYGLLTLLMVLLLSPAGVTRAQSIGIELHNTLMPASGAMGGASLATPQDIQSAVYANPATLSQFHGTTFSFSGGWVEATYNLSYDGSNAILNGIGLGPFAAKSGAPGSALGNIAVTKELELLGRPVTWGTGLMAASGASAEWRAIPNANGTSVSLTVLDIATGMGVDVTDRLSLGAALQLGTGTLDGPFLGVTAAAVAYGLRGRCGLDYDLADYTTCGFYYQTKQHFTFENNIRLQTPGPVGDIYLDTEIELPHNLGLGVSNRRLMDGRLLLACDVLYKQWTNAKFLGALYEDQWAILLGSQYDLGRIKLRLGYTWCTNPIRDTPPGVISGIAPDGGAPAVEYIQSTLAVVNPHRLSGGVGIRDVLPGVDLDIFAGGMFSGAENFVNGAVTTDLESYWVGAGFTWHCCRNTCQAVGG
jgi:long-chain fatty acid transport protein